MLQLDAYLHMHTYNYTCIHTTTTTQSTHAYRFDMAVKYLHISLFLSLRYSSMKIWFNIQKYVTYYIIITIKVLT